MRSLHGFPLNDAQGQAPQRQIPTASHLNSSKLVSIDQARSVSAGIMWLSAEDVEQNHLRSQFFILLTGRFS